MSDFPKKVTERPVPKFTAEKFRELRATLIDAVKDEQGFSMQEALDLINILERSSAGQAAIAKSLFGSYKTQVSQEPAPESQKTQA